MRFSAAVCFPVALIAAVLAMPGCKGKKDADDGARASKPAGEVKTEEAHTDRAKLTAEAVERNGVKVEAVGKAIQTAAGTFSVTLVRYDSQSKLFGKVTVRRWISEKAGIVREERTSAKSKQTLELMDFAPGP